MPLFYSERPKPAEPAKSRPAAGIGRRVCAAAILGLLFGETIKTYLFAPVPVAVAFIVGGLVVGLSRKTATEFSFFLGIPTLGAASLYSLYKARGALSMDDAGVFAAGFIAASTALEQAFRLHGAAGIL